MPSDFTFSYYSLCLVILGGMAGYAALEHTVLSLRRLDLIFPRWCAALAIGYALLAISCLQGVHTSLDDVAAFARALWLQNFSYMLMALALLGLVLAIQASKTTLPARVLQALLLAMLIAHVLMPQGLLIDTLGPLYTERTPWGEWLTYAQPLLSPFYLPFLATALLSLAWAAIQGLQMWRNGQRKYGLLIGLYALSILLPTLYSQYRELGMGMAMDPVIASLPLSLVLGHLLLTDPLAQNRDLSRRIALSESENAELSIHLEQKKQEADTLLSVISLDLRTPLVNVIGFSDDLKETLHQEDELLGDVLPDQEVRKQVHMRLMQHLSPSLDFVRLGARRLRHMIDAMQTISRLDNSPLHLQVLDPGPIAQDVLDVLAPEFEAMGAQVQMDFLAPCKADAHLLAQVMEQLLRNCVRYRSTSRTLSIHLFTKIQPAGHFARWTLLGVKDNGIGFDPARTEKLFALFHQESPDSSNATLGLGLYLARRALWRMQGDLWAEGEPDQGATFWIALPPSSTQEL